MTIRPDDLGGSDHEPDPAAPQENTDEETPPVFRQALDYAKQRLVKVSADRDAIRAELETVRSQAQVDVTRLEETLAEIRSDLYVAIGLADEGPGDTEGIEDAEAIAHFHDGFRNGLDHALAILDRISPADATLPDDPAA